MLWSFLRSVQIRLRGAHLYLRPTVCAGTYPDVHISPAVNKFHNDFPTAEVVCHQVVRSQSQMESRQFYTKHKKSCYNTSYMHLTRFHQTILFKTECVLSLIWAILEFVTQVQHRHQGSQQMISEYTYTFEETIKKLLQVSETLCSQTLQEKLPIFNKCIMKELNNVSTKPAS